MRLIHMGTHASAMLAAMLSFAVATPACASEVAAIAAAAWLRAQVQTDGSLRDESRSIAVAAQQRAETLQALAAIAAPAPSVLAARVSNEPADDVEHLARALSGLAQSQQSTSDVRTRLLAARHSDGGFGLYREMRSTALDTGLALAALGADPGSDPQVAAQALGFLTAARDASGAYGVNGESRVYVTAYALLGLEAWKNRFDVAVAAQAATTWLLAQRQAGHFASPLEDAVTLLALATRTNDPVVLKPIADALRASQGAGGSWNDDPFVTALAARALWQASRPPPAPTTGGISGNVTSAANGQAIEGATVALVERSESATTSRADGSFNLTAVPPGSYTLRVVAIGYASRQATVAVQAGQVVQVGRIALPPAPLSSSLSGVVRASNGTVLADALVAIGTVSATTNATGQYLLAGISAGTATISVSKLNYQTISISQVFEAGRSYAFSPTLYPANTTPPTDATLKGRVLDAAAGTPIAGAKLAVGAREATTGADGRFQLAALPIGAFNATLAAGGYGSATLSGTLAAGSNDVGDVRLAKTPTTSTISGIVSHVTTGAAIAGATIAVVGTSLTAVSDAAGAYRISGIANASFQLLVTATGFANTRLDVALTQTGVATLDIKLAPEPVQTGIAFREISTSKPEYSPYDEFELEVEVHNSTASGTELVIDAQVIDARNVVSFELKANANGLGQNPPNLPIALAASSLVEVELERILLRQAAGEYTVVVRGTDVNGRVVAQGTARFTVRAEALLGGGLIVDPPMTQAGIGVSINFDADLVNLGNQPIGAGDYELTVALEAADTQTASEPRTDVRTFLAGAPVSRPQGATSDAAGNVYVANASRVVRIAPDGAATIAATIPGVSLEDVAVAPDGTVWTGAADGQGRIWRIDPAGTRTELRSTSLQYVNSLTLAANGDLLLVGSHSNEHRLVRRSPAGVESILSRNGLATPLSLVRTPAGDLIVSNSGDNTLARVKPSGAIEPYLAGFDRPYGLALGADGALYVANAGSNSIERIDAGGTRSVHSTGLSNPSDIELDANGNLYVANRGDNTIARIPAGGGAAQIVARGLGGSPYAVATDSAGTLHVAGDDGLMRRKDASGNVSIVATGLNAPRDVLVGTDEVLVTSYHSGSVVRVAGGAQSNFATGLSGPFGLARTPEGSTYVTETSANRITRLAANGAVAERIDSVLSNPQTLRHDASGRLYIGSTGFISVRQGEQTRVFHRGSYTDFAPDVSSGGVVLTSGYNVVRVAADGTSRVVKSAPFYPYGGVAALPDGSIVVSDYYGRKLHRLDSSGTWSEYAALSAYPRDLVVDSTDAIYVRADDRMILKVAADRSVSTIVPALPAIYALSIAVDERPIVFAYNQGAYRIYAVDRTTGALNQVRRLDSYTWGLALDAQGVLTLSDYPGNHLIDYLGGSARIALTGFLSPRDILWTGSELRFTDQQYLYALTPGGYPTRLGAFRSDALTMRGGELYGTNGTTITRWTGTGAATVVNLPGAGLGDIDAQTDGRLTVADYSGGRVIELDAANAVVAQYAGIVGPTGLARDAAGRIHVANSNGTIARLGAADAAPTLVAHNVSSLRDLAFDPAGQVHVSRGGTVSRLDFGSGALTDLATDGQAALQGLLADATGIVAIDSSKGQVRVIRDGALAVHASGVSTLTSVREQGNGVLLASYGNGTVSRYADGRLEVLASGLVNPQGLMPRSDGSVVIVGDAGSAYLLDTERTVRPLRISSLVGGALLSGLTEAADGRLLISGYDRDAIYAVSVTQPVPPPPVGTIVHRASRAGAALTVGEGRLALDFGSWLPPYGGDFSATVTRGGVPGQTMNFVHVGPFASGVFTAQLERVPPGDQIVPLRVRLEGADFTSVSRVETGQFRKLANISFPKGMTADRSGNLYYTDNSNLHKVAPGGSVTTIAASIAPAFGLAIDSSENLYLPVQSGGQSQVLRVAPDGTRAVVASLGAVTTNGIAVNSRDEILVGRYGALLRIDPRTGATTVVTTTGIASPLGIAVDGRDNVYVQNTNHHVTQILPNGNARTIFEGANGIDQPQFEGDGYPTITADCADNFYITAFRWDRVKQYGEEHILSQVVPRTGQVVGLLDVTRVDPRVADIDYLSFDRFGNRILMWDHSTSAIYQVPVTCGAIGVEAHVLTRPGQTLTGFDRAPAASIALADGRTEYVWSLADVTSQGAALNFDTRLLGLKLGETRKAADDAFIVFRNSFSPNDVRVRMAVPSVAVDDLVAIDVATDRPEYPARATATITTTLRNANTRIVNGELRVAVLDAAGAQVGTLPIQPVTLPPAGEVSLSGDFAIGTIVPAAYTVRASLHDSVGEQARAETAFRVLADNANATAASELQLDRARYEPNDRVQIASRAISRSANVLLENLVLTLQVKDPSDITLATKHYAIAQLLPGTTQSYSYTHLLVNAAAGTYRVAQTLSDARGRVYDTDTALFAVGSSSDTGNGLTGTMAAAPAEVDVGTSVALAATVTNGGNADFAALPLRIALLDLATGTVVSSWPSQTDLSRGAQATLAQTWATTGVAPGTYTAVLIATVGGRELPLARTDVKVRAISIRVDVTQRVEPAGRVLVLLDCDRAGGDIQGGGGPTCRDTAFRDFVTAYLAAHGISHTLVTDAAAFRRELRSGRYNVYWLSGVAKLGSGAGNGAGADANLAAELREAIFRGDGLIVDGSHDARNETLEDALGAKLRGKLSERDPAIAVAATAVYAAQSLRARGPALRFEAQGATVHGRFGADAASGDAALMTHGYGFGRSVLMAFDFASMLRAEPASAAHLDVLERSLRHVTPAVPEAFGTGRYVPLTTTLNNRGVAVELEVTVTAPAGVTIESSDPAAAQASASALTWRLRLDAGQTRDLDAGLRIGDASGTVVIETRVVAVVGGTTTLLSTHRFELAIRSQAERAAAAKQSIEALAVTTAAERESRDQAHAQLVRATTALAENRHEDAIRELLDARDRLVRITSVDVTAARTTLDEMIRIAAYHAYAAAPRP